MFFDNLTVEANHKIFFFFLHSCRTLIFSTTYYIFSKILLEEC